MSKVPVCTRCKQNPAINYKGKQFQVCYSCGWDNLKKAFEGVEDEDNLIAVVKKAYRNTEVL